MIKNKKVTIKDVARVANVSPTTVSFVLNKRPGIPKETRYKVLRVARELNYTPNLLARSLVKGQTNTISMMITNTRNPIFPEISYGVDEVLRKHDYTLNIISTYDDLDLEAKEIETLRARGVDGILMSAALIQSGNIRSLVKSGFPIVSVLRRVYNCDDLDYVIVDNIKGGYLATEHLIRLGHKRIGIIKGPTKNSTAIERFQGTTQAFKNYGLAVTDDLILEGDYFKTSGYIATNAFLNMPKQKCPTSIFVSNDDMALGALEAIMDMGLKVPEDIALVGFNDVETASLPSIALTTVSQQSYKMGGLGAQRLIDKIEKRRGYKKKFQVVLEPELIIRKSCGFSSSKYTLKKARKRNI
ncbi:MAG: LacI family DNA-binding transcriptional regulator [Deltaproteobacteria bacterium]|nr:LacI family DNA-binding transcriptional regulator [Deltaproteobacteria bacterium]